MHFGLCLSTVPLLTASPSNNSPLLVFPPWLVDQRCNLKRFIERCIWVNRTKIRGFNFHWIVHALLTLSDNLEVNYYGRPVKRRIDPNQISGLRRGSCCVCINCYMTITDSINEFAPTSIKYNYDDDDDNDDENDDQTRHKTRHQTTIHVAET